MAFSKLLEGVVFALSGFVNPERATLRSQALEMGAEYQSDWTSECTMLVCAFTNTPKFRQVRSDGGTIVAKEWISECYSLKKLVDIEPYLMYAGKPWRRSGKGLKAKQDENSARPGETSGNVRKLREKTTVSDACEVRSNILGDQFSPSKITQWAVNDLRETISWLESQDERPEENEIKAIAAEGVITCLQDAIESLSRNIGIQHATEQWNFIPQVVKVLMDLEKGSSKGLPSKEELKELATRCKEIYELEYDGLHNKKNKKQKIEDNHTRSAGAQANSGDDGFDSDETIEMTEEEIVLACKQLS